MAEKFLAEKVLVVIGGGTGLGFSARPAFLGAGARARFSTGQVLAGDGGRTASEGQVPAPAP